MLGDEECMAKCSQHGLDVARGQPLEPVLDLLVTARSSVPVITISRPFSAGHPHRVARPTRIATAELPVKHDNSLYVGIVKPLLEFRPTLVLSRGLHVDARFTRDELKWNREVFTTLVRPSLGGHLDGLLRPFNRSLAAKTGRGK
jgi:hypothetical protein